MSDDSSEGLSVELGKRVKTHLDIGPFFDNSAGAAVKIRQFVRIPFTVINGSLQGPTLCVTGGTHPTEYHGIDAAIRLSNEIKPDDLRGRLIVVPVVNIPGFWARSYLCPIDGVNLNDCFSKGGRSDGTIGEMIAYRILREIVSKSDYWLDLHGSDTSETHLGYTIAFRIGDPRIDVESEAIARALGIKIGKYYRTDARELIPGTKPIPRAIVEVGPGDKLVLESSSAVFEGILNVMRYLKMTGGEILRQEDVHVNSESVAVNHEGLFHYQAKVGDILERNQVIGELRDLQGELLETLRNPHSRGVLMRVIHNPVVRIGEQIVKIGVFQE